MKFIKFVIGLVFVSCLSACLASSPMQSTYSPEKLQANLVVGKTTKDEVRKMYGGAYRDQERDGGDTWTYFHTKKRGLVQLWARSLPREELVT